MQGNLSTGIEREIYGEGLQKGVLMLLARSAVCCLSASDGCMYVVRSVCCACHKKTY